MFKPRILVAAVGLSFLLSVPSVGQGTTIDIGPRLGADVLGDVEEVFFGLDVRLGIPSLPVAVNPTFDYYLTDSGFDFYQLSVNALLNINAPGMPTISPYVGAGLGIARTSVDVDLGSFGSISGDDTDIGINLIGGGSIDAGSFHPFAQVQITLLGDVNLISATVGALFRIKG